MSVQILEQGPILRVKFRPPIAWPARILYGGLLLILVAAALILRRPSVPPVIWLLCVPFLPLAYYLTFRESVVVSPGSLRIERRALGVLSWSQEYPLDDVRWFRAIDNDFTEDEAELIGCLGRAIGGAIVLADPRTRRILFGYGVRRLGFDVDGITRWTGPGLTDGEAAAVAESVGQRIHSNQRTVDTRYT